MILVVDDEKAVLQTTAWMLRLSGFKVLEASGGAEALLVLESRTDVMVLLTDCNMPVVSGADLAREVLRRWPQIRIIAMSGQPRSDEMPARAHFIAKPFRASALVPLMKVACTARVEAAAAHAAPFPASTAFPA